LTTKSETISCLIGFIAIGLFVLVLVTYLPAFAQTNNTNTSSLTNSNQLATYEDPLLGFKFQYPPEWQQLLDKNIEDTGVAFNIFKLVKGDEIPSLGIRTDNLPENQTLKQYLREFISKEFCCVDHQSLKTNEIKLGDIPAMNASWNLSEGGKVFGREMLVFGIKDNIAYLIHYKTSSDLFEKWLPQVKNIIKSLQITD
jgi:PsbP-like protein